MSATATKSRKSPTLASMAAKPAKEETTVPVVFDWDNAEAPEVVVYHRVAAQIDYEAITPASIKIRVNDGYSKSLTAANAGEKRPVWIRHKWSTAEQAQEFVKLSKRYGAFKGYTVRDKINADEPTVAVICVKPKETRARKGA